MTIKGGKQELKDIIRYFNQSYPEHVIDNLACGEWFFVLNGVEIQLVIEEEDE